MSNATTIAIDREGANPYDFGLRAKYIRACKMCSGIPSETPPGAPKTLDLKGYDDCNSQCPYCAYRRVVSMGNRGSLLPKATVIPVLEETFAAGTRGLVLSGGGEPLLIPYFQDILTMAASHNVDVMVQTNGKRLKKFCATPDALRKFKIISISIGAHTSELYRIAAGSGGFDSVVNTIRHIVALKRQHAIDVEINIKILVFTGNYLHIPDIVKFYNNLGVDSIGIRLVQGWDNPDVELSAQQREELLSSISSLPAIHPALAAFARGMSAALPAENSTILSQCFCATDGHYACIRADGGVYVGTPEIDDPDFCIGNITQSPWSEVWGSAQHHRVIERMNALLQSGKCSDCRHLIANRAVHNYQEEKGHEPTLVDFPSPGHLGSFM